MHKLTKWKHVYVLLFFYENELNSPAREKPLLVLFRYCSCDSHQLSLRWHYECWPEMANEVKAKNDVHFSLNLRVHTWRIEQKVFMDLNVPFACHVLATLHTDSIVQCWNLRQMSITIFREVSVDQSRLCRNRVLFLLYVNFGSRSLDIDARMDGLGSGPAEFWYSIL